MLSVFALEVFVMGVSFFPKENLRFISSIMFLVLLVAGVWTFLLAFAAITSAYAVQEVRTHERRFHRLSGMVYLFAMMTFYVKVLQFY